jgi:hypothetical protein
MTDVKIFTLAEANILLPKLKTMLLSANRELTAKAESLAEAHVINEKCEKEMSKVKTVKGNGDQNDSDLSHLRECRAKFQESIISLAQAKEEYIDTLNFWLEEITETGVILRDIKSGLLDFTADAGEFHYYLCWQADEEDIQYWHLINDGFIGRRPLAVLSEYL